MLVMNYLINSWGVGWGRKFFIFYFNSLFRTRLHLFFFFFENFESTVEINFLFLIIYLELENYFFFLKILVLQFKLFFSFLFYLNGRVYSSFHKGLLRK